jgi:LysM repeat protein
VRSPSSPQGKPLNTLLSVLLWGVAVLMVLFTAYAIYVRAPRVFTASAQVPGDEVQTPVSEQANAPAQKPAALPEYLPASGMDALVRVLNTHTNLPAHVRAEAVSYTVQKGDSIFAIANDYKLKPDTILWANYDTLRDDPDTISVGMKLRIPPSDGVYYQWKAGDTLDGIAQKFKSTVDAILNFPGNDLDLTDPQVKPDTYVLIPGGKREYHQWIVPTIWRANAGASRNIAGGCNTSGSAVMGSGSFIWPTQNHFLSGNDYFSGHLGIDIAAATGAPVWAADSGVVVYAAPIGGGYGNMVMIDHGNGYHTLYAHLSQIVAKCGQGVSQGATIAYAGSTGNSTGPHLHFEVRYLGGFINPWYVLK